jgi:hypothetical protein
MRWFEKKAMPEIDNSLGALTMTLDSLKAQSKGVRDERARQEIEPLVAQVSAQIAGILRKYHDQGVGFGNPEQVERLRPSREKWFGKNLPANPANIP